MRHAHVRARCAALAAPVEHRPCGERRKVKLIVGTVGVQVFDLKRKLLVTLHIKEMPEWTIGKTLRDTDKGASSSPVRQRRGGLGR